MAKTNAQKKRALNQESLRELLSKQGHLQHILEITGKLQEPKGEIDQNMVNRYKIVIDTKLKLLNKYLPDLKQVEMEVDATHNGSLTFTWAKAEEESSKDD